MTSVVNPDALPHATAPRGEVRSAAGLAGSSDEWLFSGQTASKDHDADAKDMLRRYLSQIHSFREIGNHALRNLEARLATKPESDPSEQPDPLPRDVPSEARAQQSSILVQPSLSSQAKAAGEDDGLQRRLYELSTYLHADLTKERAASDSAARRRASASEPPAPKPSHKMPNLPVLDRNWFEERFAALRTAIEEAAEQAPLKRIAALEAQFEALMERLSAREAARMQQPMEAALKDLAAYLADSKEWAAASDRRVKTLEDKIDRLSGLVAQSQEAISATARELQRVADKNGDELARETADLVSAKMAAKLDGLNAAERIDQLGREVAYLTAQSRHLAMSANQRLSQIEAAVEKKPPAHPDAQHTSVPSSKRAAFDTEPGVAFESHFNPSRSDNEDDGYDSDMIAAAQRAARFAEGASRNRPSSAEPARHQIPYSEFLHDDDHTASRAGLIIAIVILLLAGGAMFLLKLRDAALPEPKPAVHLHSVKPQSASAAKPHPEMGVLVVTGSTPAALPIGAKPVNLWLASDVETGPGATTAALPNDGAQSNASWREAAIKGDLDAQFSVGQDYLSGREGWGSLTASDRLSRAARWFRRAAESGHAPSQYRLATLYELGRGLPRNLALAAEWYGRAARQDHVRAMHNLAVLESGGHNRPADYTAAAKWFRQAADRGLADSQFNLGVLYERGLGVARNLPEAYRWFSLAARQNDGKAMQKRDELGRLLTGPERQKADRLASAWKAKPAAQEMSRTQAARDLSAARKEKPSQPAPAGNPSAAVMRASWTTNIAANPGARSGGAAMIVDAQRMLKEMGYDPGPVDGIPGPRTEAAIRSFQRRMALAVTGKVTEELVVKMAFRPL